MTDSVWIGLVGAVGGLLVALAVDYIVRLHIDVRRLRDAPRQLEAEREVREEERRLPGLALIARVQGTMQSKGLDKPLPAVDEWRAPPPGQPI